MSRRAEDYAKAVLALREEGVSEAAIAKGLAAALIRRGERRLTSSIERELAALIERRARREQVTLTLARESDTERYRDEIAGALGEIASRSSDATRTDERIVGGFILESGERRYDASYRQALRTLYHRLTSTTA